MLANDVLAICIPTYNRAEFVKYQLQHIIPSAKKFGIELVVSDNSENSETAELVSKFQEEYPLIQYHRNERNIGDLNFMKAISYPAACYRWIITDSTLFDEAQLLRILSIAEQKKYDYILVNARTDKAQGEKEYSDYNQLLSDLGWRLTHLSSFVYSGKVVDLVGNVKRYQGGNFLQHALLFENLPYYHMSVYWIGDICLDRVPMSKKNSWNEITYELWNKRWTDYVLSLPDRYSLAAKLKCIKDHGRRSGLFSLEKIARHYATGVYNKKAYRLYREYFPYTQKHRAFLRLIFFFPQKVPYAILRLASKIWGRIILSHD